MELKATTTVAKSPDEGYGFWSSLDMEWDAETTAQVYDAPGEGLGKVLAR